MEAIRSSIKKQLLFLDAEMNQVPAQFAELLSGIPDQNRDSAINFLQYLVLRKHDIRELQHQLHVYGLSSLASCENHTHRQIQVTLERLGVKPLHPASCTMDAGLQKMETRSNRLFGSPREAWPSSVMVTMDASFLQHKNQIESLLIHGMGVARINCAHDSESVWLKMIEKIKEASKKTGLPCQIHLDLAGPKIRTVLLKKGKENGKAEIKKGGKIWLSDVGKGFSSKDIVVNPNEPGVVQALKVGERVFFDDGLILARVDKVTDRGVALMVERISSKKPLLKAEKGINFPDSDLAVPSLTPFDLACLPFASAYADTIGFSFVRRPEDLARLRAELSNHASVIPPIILKIETQEAVVRLPELLLEGMKEPDFGVMIARGDLAVEIGFERLVEIQEEISWLCEAAHVPVIWATQVLENLHKSGIASRAEITDAGRAAMAECIMINKGDHTLQVLKTLQDIAKRSRALKVKNRLTFRPLKIAEQYFERL